MIAFYRAWLSIRKLEVPTIAAVNGAAIGAGLCLALACDIRYAATGAKLGAPFVRLGMHAGMAGTYLLPNVVGEAHARDLLLTGRVVEADEALRLGLVSRVIEPEAFLDEVLRDGGRDRRHRAHRQPADQAGAGRRRAPPTSRPACSGRRWPSRSRWPPRTSRRASGPAARSEPRSSRDADHVKRPPDRLTTLAFPLRVSIDGPGASSGRERLGAGGAAVNPCATYACGQTCGETCGRRAIPVEDPRSGPGFSCGGHARGAAVRGR